MFRDDTRWKRFDNTADTKGHGLITETLVRRYDMRQGGRGLRGNVVG
jgi:hypothetical protein